MNEQTLILAIDDKSRRDCLSELVSIDPSARILLVGDQNPISGLGHEHRKTVAGFLQKPFGMTDFLGAAHSIL